MPDAFAKIFRLPEIEKRDALGSPAGLLRCLEALSQEQAKEGNFFRLCHQRGPAFRFDVEAGLLNWQRSSETNDPKSRLAILLC